MAYHLGMGRVLTKSHHLRGCKELLFGLKEHCDELAYQLDRHIRFSLSQGNVLLTLSNQ